jgi:hypothetical protein
MSDAPERIWIDAWGGNWSPRSGGTQEIEYIRADRIEALEAKLAKAMTHVMDYSNDPHLVQFARATLAEIAGEKA